MTIVDSRTDHPSTSPVMTGVRAAVVPVLARSLSEHNIQLDVPDLWTIVDDLARVMAVPAARWAPSDEDLSWIDSIPLGRLDGAA